MTEANPSIIDIFVNLHLACFKVINTAAVMPKLFAFVAALQLKGQKSKILGMVSEEVRRRWAGSLKLAAGGQEEKKQEDTCGREEDTDVLGEMMKVKDGATGKDLTDAVIADYMISIIFASMSTTAAILTNVFSDLAGRPSYQAGLRAEGKAALLSCAGGKVDENFLDKLPKMTAFFRESARLASLPIQGVRT